MRSLTKALFEQYQRLDIIRKDDTYEAFCADAKKSRAKINTLARKLEKHGITLSVKFGDDTEFIKL
jgi:hypothetical protein